MHVQSLCSDVTTYIFKTWEFPSSRKSVHTYSEFVVLTHTTYTQHAFYWQPNVVGSQPHLLMPCVYLTPFYTVLLALSGINSLICFVSEEALLGQKCITSLNEIYCTLEIPSTNSHPLTFTRQVFISTYYTNVIRVRTLTFKTIMMWALQKVGFTAGATQETQPWLSCTFTKVVFTCSRICLIHSLVAELLTDHFAVQWVPTPTTNCSPLSIDVHFHASLSLSGPTSQPNSNWMGEGALIALGAQHRVWSCTQLSTPTNSRSHYICFYINARQIWKSIAYSSGLELLVIQIPFVTAMA